MAQLRPAAVPLQLERPRCSVGQGASREQHRGHERRLLFPVAHGDGAYPPADGGAPFSAPALIHGTAHRPAGLLAER